MASRMMICAGLLLFTCFGAGPASGWSEPDDEGFRPLFNGEDLSGWVLVNTPPQTWNVMDGMLVCTGKPIGEIRTGRMYQNFILEVEWRHMVPGGNAGIFVWADDITSKGVPFHRSVEVQVLENAYGQSQHHTTHGDIFPIHGATMTPVNGRGGSRAFPTEERSRPSPEWNHYRIECNDGAISLAVNGKVVTRGTDASPRKGYICLESEGGVVHYRNLRIRELPETPVDPQHVAIENRGYHSLYSGLDLSGWTVSDGGRAHWHVQDWVLSFDGKPDVPEDALLTRGDSVSESGFLFDIRPGAGFSSLKVCGVPVDAKLKSGEWTRLEGQVRQGRLTISVQGNEIASQQLPANVAPHFSLLPEGAAEFANVYLRTL